MKKNESAARKMPSPPAASLDEKSLNERPESGERLQKLIARAGVASRRAAEELITQGRVTVNGEVMKELGAKADPSHDRISVDGKPLIFSDHPPVVVLLHKPRGFVTTKSDPEGRATVLDLLPNKLQNLHPIGRLDFDTSGVLLLTDDGELTHLLTHPSHGVEKIYHTRVGGQVSEATLKKLQSGVWIESGDTRAKTAPCRARLKAQTENNSLVEVALREGRNRQVRKMFEAVGHPVSSLRRVSFAGIELEGLPSGAHRVLLPGEVHSLKKRASQKIAAKSASEKKAFAKAATDDLSVAAPKKLRSPASSHSSGPSHPKKLKPKSSDAMERNAARQNSPLAERIRRQWK